MKKPKKNKKKWSNKFYQAKIDTWNFWSLSGMRTPPVFCVGRTQGSSRSDTGEFFSDTGEFEGEFVLMGGGVLGEANKVCVLYMKDQNLLNRINIDSGPRAFGARDTC